jgi:hypothetical protein
MIFFSLSFERYSNNIARELIYFSRLSGLVCQVVHHSGQVAFKQNVLPEKNEDVPPLMRIALHYQPKTFSAENIQKYQICQEESTQEYAIRIRPPHNSKLGNSEEPSQRVPKRAWYYCGNKSKP